MIDLIGREETQCSVMRLTSSMEHNTTRLSCVFSMLEADFNTSGARHVERIFIEIFGIQKTIYQISFLAIRELLLYHINSYTVTRLYATENHERVYDKETISYVYSTFLWS